MASRPETIKKMQMAQKLHKSGISVKQIAKKMKLSQSRVRELIDGHNWYSKRGERVRIA